MVGWLMNNEFETLSKEAFVAQFEALVWHLSGGTEVNHENP
jgi:hypothetical protein